jgi:3-hydroxyisobutyrate dehydrogenase
MARIAFIGLGKMGSGMAGRLLAAGHQLRIYNRTASKASSLVRDGAVLCDSAAEAARNVDAIISMVANDDASRDIWLGPGGVLSDAAPGVSFVIECSTLSHEWVLELAAEVRRRGLRYIDAPVTGLPNNAASGDLTLLVGAETADLDAVRGLLSAFSQRVIHFGAVGTGTAYKLIINLLGAVQIASAAESMALAARAGLDLRIVADAIATGQAASPQVIRNTRRMVDADHDRNIAFTPRLRFKDVDYALRLASKLGLGAPFGALAAQAFGQLCNTGHGDENESNVILIARAQPPAASG